MHRGAARQRERRGRHKVHIVRQFCQRTLGHNHLLSKTAVALDADHLTVEAKRLLAVRAILALAAKNIGLDRDAVAPLPIPHALAGCKDRAGDFAAWRARQRDGQRQTALFEPEIEMIQATGEHLHDDLAGRRFRVRQVTKLKLTWFSAGNELDGFHCAH